MTGVGSNLNKNQLWEITLHIMKARIALALRINFHVDSVDNVVDINTITIL